MLFHTLSGLILAAMLQDREGRKHFCAFHSLTCWHQSPAACSEWQSLTAPPAHWGALGTDPESRGDDVSVRWLFGDVTSVVQETAGEVPAHVCICLWNHTIIKAGKDLQDHLVPPDHRVYDPGTIFSQSQHLCQSLFDSALLR